MRVVAFTGPKGCGKNTAAKILLEDEQTKANFRYAPMAEGVKNICNDFFGWDHQLMDDGDFKETPLPGWASNDPEYALEPRWAMMDIANWLRDRFGGGVHTRRWMRHAQYDDANEIRLFGKARCHVMTDLRFPEEHRMVLEHGGLVIYVARPSAEDALQKKKAMGDQMSLNPSEAFYDDIKGHPKTIIIPNNRTPYHLWNEVRTAVKNHYGHPLNWIDECEPMFSDPINYTGKE